jgi:hypothetical protein
MHTAFDKSPFPPGLLGSGTQVHCAARGLISDSPASSAPTRVRNCCHLSCCVSRVHPPGANRFHQGRVVALGLVGILGCKFRES